MGVKKNFDSVIDLTTWMVDSENPQSSHDAVQMVDNRVMAPPPRWRRKAPALVDARVLQIIEGNYAGLAEAFEAMDANMDGKISLRELRAGLAAIDPSIEFTDRVLIGILAIADDDGSGGIDVEEFLAHFGPHAVTKREIRDGLSNMGRTADGKGSAYLSLAISSSKLHDIVAVQPFQQLQFLDLSNNVLEDLSPLGSLPYLLELDVSANRLKTILSFTAPIRLRKANCSKNEIATMNDISAHRFLEHLDLSGNQISRIQGVSRNRVLRTLILDNNQILEISGLADVPIQHLSMRCNELSAINGRAPLSEEEEGLLALLHSSYEELEDAFVAMDVNADGMLDRKEILATVKILQADAPHTGGNPAEHWESVRRTVDTVIARLDPQGNGSVPRRHFLSVFRRATPAESDSTNDPGISLLTGLRYVDLSLNPISTLAGLNALTALRFIGMAGTGISSLEELDHLKPLSLLENLDLSGCSVCDPSSSLRKAGCFRLRAIKRLQAPLAQCKLVQLNGHLVAAEEIVAANNFFDKDHLQYMDVRRHDAQDIPPSLFR